jgi:hypothetical protein
MEPSRVYGVCESERVAETLAVLVEPNFEFRWLTPLTVDPRQWPRPALVIDARRQRPVKEPFPARVWPGVPSLRLELADTFDPAATQQAIAQALHETESVERPRLTALHAIATDLKPRLIAVRLLTAMARHSARRATSSWRDLLRRQLQSLCDTVERLGLGGDT